MNLGWQGTQEAHLGGREESLRDSLAREIGVVELDIDADLSRAAERVQSDGPGVGQVERTARSAGAGFSNSPYWNSSSSGAAPR